MMLPVRTQPIYAAVKSVFVRLQADDSLRSDHGVMDNASWQVEPIACFQIQLFAKPGQAERDTSLHYINHFIVGMRMSRVDIMRLIRPRIRT